MNKVGKLEDFSTLLEPVLVSAPFPGRPLMPNAASSHWHGNGRLQELHRCPPPHFLRFPLPPRRTRTSADASCSSKGPTRRVQTGPHCEASTNAISPVTSPPPPLSSPWSSPTPPWRAPQAPRLRARARRGPRSRRAGRWRVRSSAC